MPRDRALERQRRINRVQLYVNVLPSNTVISAIIIKDNIRDGRWIKPGTLSQIMRSIRGVKRIGIKRWKKV